MVTKLAIGSANFGLDYGIANQRRLGRDEAFQILEMGMVHGWWGVDTAKGYGDAEAVIGAFLKEKGQVLRVITKLPRKAYSSAQEVEREIIDSLRTLNASSLDIVLFHSYDTYEQYGRIVLPVLDALCRDRVIGRYGVSVYDPQEADAVSRAITRNLAIEFPVNLFDRRFLKPGVMERLHANGTFLLARSVFLQGLFFLKEGELRGPLKRAGGRIARIEALAKEFGVTTASVALLFVVTTPWIDTVIVGVDSTDHLACHVRSLTDEVLDRYQHLEHLLPELEMNDEEILIPSRWPR